MFDWNDEEVDPVLLFFFQICIMGCDDNCLLGFLCFLGNQTAMTLGFPN